MRSKLEEEKSEREKAQKQVWNRNRCGTEPSPCLPSSHSAFGHLHVTTANFSHVPF